MKKRVYYLSGFDPRGARFYHRLYKEEAKNSATLSGAEITVGKRTILNKLVCQWKIDAVWNGAEHSTDYRFLTWDDVIKQFWVSNIGVLIFKSIPMYWSHIQCRLFAKFRQAARGPYICSIYPAVFVSIAAIATALMAVLVSLLANFLFNYVLLNAVLAIATTYFMMKFFNNLGEKLNVWWILQTYFFISQWGEKPLPNIEQRNNEFAEQIIQDQLESPADEILLVGHCVGTMMAIAVIDNIINRQHAALKGKLSIITLGQCMCYLSYIPTALHFRASLQNVVNNETFPWVNFGARADPLCFEQVSPAVADGVHITCQHRPCNVTVKPYLMFTPEKYANLKKNKLRVHFQYLMSADIKTDYDYFELTAQANPKFLADILSANQSSSKNTK